MKPGNVQTISGLSGAQCTQNERAPIAEEEL